MFEWKSEQERLANARKVWVEMWRWRVFGEQWQQETVRRRALAWGWPVDERKGL